MLAQYLYQNIIHAESGDIVHREVLSRPENMQGKDTLEAFFESMPPQTQLEWLEDQLDELSKHGDSSWAVNLSATCLVDDTTRPKAAELLRRHPYPVIIEITEGNPLPEAAVLNGFFNSLRQFGHRFALDDFGSGCNQHMSLIADYDFDIIKIDRSLTQDVDNRHVYTHLRLLRQFLRLASKTAVVEGIETQHQLDMLSTLGYELFQAFISTAQSLQQ